MEKRFLEFPVFKCGISLKSHSKQAVCHSQYRSNNIFCHLQTKCHLFVIVNENQLWSNIHSHTALLFRSASYVTMTQILSTEYLRNRVWIKYVNGKCVGICGSLHILKAASQ